MHRKTAVFVAASFALVMLVMVCGCSRMNHVVASLENVIGRGADSLATKRITDHPIYFKIPGPIAIDVESFNGDVRIRVVPDLDTGVLTFSRRAVHGFGRTDDAKLSLRQIHCEAGIVPGELGQVLQIRTTTTHAEPHYQRADVIIELPNVDGVRVRTRSGHVYATGVGGEIDIVTSDGDVRVMTEEPLLQAVRIFNNGGDIDYRVRAESTGELDCSSLRGRVFHNARHGRLIVHEGTSFDVLRATLNDGRNPVVLRTADGDVRLAVVEAPMQVGPATVD